MPVPCYGSSKDHSGAAMQRLKHASTVLMAGTAVLAFAGVTLGQQQPPPSAMSGAQKLMVVPGSKYPGRMHVLPATMETTQWGWFDNAELPRLTIDSGDTVAVETMAHA